MSGDREAAPADYGARVARLSTGWGRLEIGLARVWFWRVGGYKGVVLWAVIERAWCVPWFDPPGGGRHPDPVPCRLNVSELARATGLNQPGLSTAKRQLVAAGDLIEHPDGTLEPNKRYDLYADAPPPGILAYGLAGADLAGSTHLSEKPDRKRPRTYTKKRIGAATHLSEKPDRNLSEKPDSFSADSPISLRVNSRESNSPARPPAPAPARPPDPPRPSPREEAAVAMGDCLPGDVVPDEAVLRKCLAKAEAWYPNRDDIRTGLRLHRKQIPTAWMFVCMKRLAIKGQVNPSWRLMLTIMVQDYFAPGPDGKPLGPGPGIDRDYDDDLRLLPPTARGPGGPRPPGSGPAPPPLPPPVRLDEAQRSRFALPERTGGGYNGFPHGKGGGR